MQGRGGAKARFARSRVEGFSFIEFPAHVKVRAEFHEHNPAVWVEFEGALVERFGFVEPTERIKRTRDRDDETHLARSDLQTALGDFNGLPELLVARRWIVPHFREGGVDVGEAEVEIDVLWIALDALPGEVCRPMSDRRFFQ